MNDNTKGNIGGFAVSGKSSGKSNAVPFTYLIPKNYFIGTEPDSKPLAAAADSIPSRLSIEHEQYHRFIIITCIWVMKLAQITLHGHIMFLLVTRQEKKIFWEDILLFGICYRT